MCLTAILDKATTFEYYYPKPFWVFDWIKLGLSGAVIRWSWFCLGLACPALTFLSNPDFDHFTPSSIHFNPKNAEFIATSIIIACGWWGHSGKSHLIKKLLDGIWGSNTIVLTMRCVVVVLREERREGCLSSKSLLDGERPGPLSPGLDLRATNCILA